MKIKKIEQEGYIFYVTTTASFLERLFGFKTKTNIIRDKGMYVGEKNYVDDDHNRLPMDNKLVIAIEEFRNKK